MSKNTVLTAIISLAIMVCNPGLSIGADSSPRSGKTLGEAKILGNGVAWSWVENNSEGNPIALGITFSETALSGLPENLPSDAPGWEYELPMPKEAKVAPYNHIVMNWNPHGHIPPGIYDVPHFDFHLYMITPRERKNITAKGDDIARLNKKPPARYVPTGYILPDGTQEARMGSHWIDPSAPEFNQQPFTRTFIYGSYNGMVTFIEPMITKAFLESRQDVTESIKQPEAFQKPGYYPTQYSVKYDPVRKEYTVAVEGLIFR